MKENKLDYIPEPMDLSSVDLPESLIQLSERIAENVHEVWAKARIDEGWTYGEKRDDIHKKHPCLVPYDELPEEEKEYPVWLAQQQEKQPPRAVVVPEIKPVCAEGSVVYLENGHCLLYTSDAADD